MSITDLAIIMHYLWLDDPTILSSERQRVQLAFIMLIMAYSGSRPGALMDNKNGEEQCRGLLYDDIELVLIRDPLNPEVYMLIMHVTLHHMKGREGEGKPYVINLLIFEHF